MTTQKRARVRNLPLGPLLDAPPVGDPRQLVLHHQMLDFLQSRLVFGDLGSQMGHQLLVIPRHAVDAVLQLGHAPHQGRPDLGQIVEIRNRLQPLTKFPELACLPLRPIAHRLRRPGESDQQLLDLIRFRFEVFRCSCAPLLQLHLQVLLGPLHRLFRGIDRQPALQALQALFESIPGPGALRRTSADGEQRRAIMLRHRAGA